ncbi:MAG TPA: ribosome-associated translation inhibitor RaiA [Candidatus Paceibacterota bacterium]|nr:ribosome-associated translation inhibitor RaiA [Candidatus Paceibacterota bacterium]
MKITIKKTLDVTPPLETYIEEKLMPLAKFLEPYERNGETELRLEVSRTSEHHRKGDEVFMAAADLELPGKVLRSEASAADIRAAIDQVRTMLHMEIEKYKTKHSYSTETEREK